MEIDCDGHLWLIDQVGQLIYEVESGESHVCAFNEIPWLSEDPTAGYGRGEREPCRSSARSTRRASRRACGRAQLKVVTDTPYRGVAGAGGLHGAVPGRAGREPLPGVHLRGGGRGGDAGVRSGGVPVLSGRAGDAGGHGGLHPAGGARGGLRADAVRGSVQRRARGRLQRGLHPVVLRRGLHGGLRRRQLLSGRGAHAWPDGGVHPEGGRTARATCRRRARATHVFDDVPCPPTPEAPFGDWIGQLFVEGITAGCGATTFCPDAGIPNEQMATFLVRAFHLPR